MDESERMAYSTAFVPSLFSNSNDQGHAESNVETTLIHGGSWGVWRIAQEQSARVVAR